MWYVISVLMGLAVGFISSRIIFKPKNIPRNIGVLNVVESDDGPPYLFVELKESAYQLYNERVVTMDVKAVYTNSQK